MTSRHETTTAPAYPPVASKPDRACNGVDPEIFYPQRVTDLDLDDYAHFDLAIDRDDAKTICRRCPHRQLCLDWALTTRQAFGIWGATTPAERDRMLKETP